jgi:hypothetical protein
MAALSHDERRRKLRELAAGGAYASVVEMLKACAARSTVPNPSRPRRTQTFHFRDPHPTSAPSPPTPANDPIRANQKCALRIDARIVVYLIG